MNDRVALAEYPLALADGTLVGYTFVIELYRGARLLSTCVVHNSQGEVDALDFAKHHAIALDKFNGIHAQVQGALDARANAASAAPLHHGAPRNGSPVQTAP